MKKAQLLGVAVVPIPGAWVQTAAEQRARGDSSSSSSSSRPTRTLLCAHAGTKSIERLEENVGSLSVSLSAEEVAELEAAVPASAVAGARY